MWKRRLIVLCMLLLYINIASAAIRHTNNELLNLDSPWKIEKQDYLQDNILYSLYYVGDNKYILHYELLNKTLFSELYNKKSDNKAFNDLAKSVKGSNSEQLKKDIEELYTKPFPIYVLDGDIIISGVVDPFKSPRGIIEIQFKKDISKVQNAKIKIGFGTLIIAFSNGLTQEALNLGYEMGLYESAIRYLSIPIKVNINSSAISFNGSSNYNSIFTEYDKFSSGVDTTIWNISSSGANLYSVGGRLEISFDTGRPFAYNPTYAIAAGYGTDVPVDFNAEMAIFLHYYLYSFCSATYTYDNGIVSSDYILFDESGNSVKLVNHTGYQATPTTYGIARYLKIELDPTGATASIKNNTNGELFQVSLAALNPADKWYIKIQGNATAPGLNTNCEMNFYTYALAYNTNRTIYENYTWGSGPYPHTPYYTLPNNTHFSVGGFEVLYNSTQISSRIERNITSQMITAYNNGICNCTGCLISGGKCNVPLTFTSTNGGTINVLNVSVLYDYDYELVLIDEETGLAFNVTNVTSCKLYNDNNITLFDFKADNNVSTYTFTGSSSEKLRIIIGYESGEYVTRYIDSGLIENASNMRICANKEGVLHYEQLITSVTQRAVLLHSTYANCYVAADYTRFAYQDKYLLKAFTTNRPYSLIVYSDNEEVVLAGLDGSFQSSIDIDQLEFKNRKYDIRVISDALATSKYLETVIIISYVNVAENNEVINMTITNLDDDSIVYFGNTFANNDYITVYFDYSLYNITNSTLFEVKVQRSTAGGSYEIKKYFNNQGSMGFLKPKFAFILAILFFVFGITWTVSKTTFSWFGIIMVIAAMIITSYAIPAWYLSLLNAMFMISLVYIIIIMLQQNKSTVS